MDVNQAIYYYKIFFNFLNPGPFNSPPRSAELYEAVMDLSAWARESNHPLFLSIQVLPSTFPDDLSKYCELAFKAISNFICPPVLNSLKSIEEFCGEFVLAFFLNGVGGNPRVMVMSKEQVLKNDFRGAFFAGWLPLEGEPLEAYLFLKKFGTKSDRG